MNQRQEEHFTQDAVSAIIRRALPKSKGNTVSYQDMLETAEELGIDRESLEAAISEHRAAEDRDRLREEWHEKSREKFRSEILSYVGVSIFLSVIDFLTEGGPWCHWVVLIWGAGLIGYAFEVYFPDREKLESKLDEMQKEQANETQPQSADAGELGSRRSECCGPRTM